MPSIIDGLFAGRAGIQAHGTAISVLADNIANQNTTGFKQSRPDFADLLAGTLSGGSSIQTGSGSKITSVTQILNQGTFEFTGRGLDVGIDGNGFFVVEDSASTGQRFYTRAGNFRVDTEGYLLDQNGYRVLGFPANGSGGLEGLNVNERTQASFATDEVLISGNLDAGSAIQAHPGAGTTDFQTLNDAAQFSTFVEVFDSLGDSHTVTMYFYHTATTPAQTWDAYAYVDAGEVGGTVGDAALLSSDTMTFDSGGNQVAPVGSIVANPIAWDNGATAGNITFTLDPFTQFSSASSISAISQDGTGSGSVVGFNMESDGTLFAQLDNGETSAIGTIALSIFANGEGLQRVGNSVYAETTSSGEPVVGSPGTGTFGGLQAGALELSTSDIASDFIKLISIQRGFQGSSRIITNIDDLLNEIINLA